MNRLFRIGCLFLLAPVVLAQDATTDEANPTPDPSTNEAVQMNVPMPTGGGIQFWTDHLIRDGNRLQQHAVTGHWRVVDAGGIRRAWGKRDECAAALDDLKSWSAEDDDGRTVTMLLHGLMRTRHCMKKLAAHLDETGDTKPVTFGYASTRAGVPDHAEALQDVILDWPSSWKIQFVGHSMGNIVVRRWVHDRQSDPKTKDMVSRCTAMVMLGPPNQGSQIAERLGPTGLFGLITGKGGMQMGPTYAEIADTLAIPPFPFAIIAGDLSGGLLKNPLLDGPNDLVVTVAEAKLEGSVSFETVGVAHSFLMDHADVVPKVSELLSTMTLDTNE